MTTTPTRQAKALLKYLDPSVGGYRTPKERLERFVRELEVAKRAGRREAIRECLVILEERRVNWEILHILREKLEE